MQGSRRIGKLYAAFAAENNSAGIYLLVYHEGGYTGDILAVDYRPVDRRRTAILRQQGGVQVKGSAFRHGPDHFRQHPEAHHYKQIGLPGGQFAQELFVLQFFRLQQRQALFYRILLYGALVHLESATGRLVRYGNYAHNPEAAPDKRIQRSHGEFRGTHIYNSGLTEHTEEFTLNPAETGLEQIDIQDAGILDGLNS